MNVAFEALTAHPPTSPDKLTATADLFGITPGEVTLLHCISAKLAIMATNGDADAVNALVNLIRATRE